MFDASPGLPPSTFPRASERSRDAASAHRNHPRSGRRKAAGSRNRTFGPSATGPRFGRIGQDYPVRTDPWTGCGQNGGPRQENGWRRITERRITERRITERGNTERSNGEANSGPKYADSITEYDHRQRPQLRSGRRLSPIAGGWKLARRQQPLG